MTEHAAKPAKSATGAGHEAGLWRDALPALFVVLWATGFIGSRLGAPYSEPFTFLAVRFAAAAVLMIAICLILRVTWPSGRTAWVHAATIGLLVHGVYLGGVFWAIDRGVSPGVAALIVAMQPLLTGLAAGPLLGETVSGRHWLGLALGFTGVAMVVGNTADPAAGDYWAIGACVVSMLGLTAGALYQKKTGESGNLLSQQAVQLSAAAVLLSVLSFGVETQTLEWSPAFVVALVWLTVVMSLGTFTLLYVLIRRGAASKVASLFYLVPPVAAVMAYLLFDTTLSPVAIAGMAVAVSGVALATREA